MQIGVIKAMERVEMKKGEIVFKQGDRCDKFYVVASGELDAYQREVNVETEGGQGVQHESDTLLKKEEADGTGKVAANAHGECEKEDNKTAARARSRRLTSTVHDLFGYRIFRLMYAQHFGDLSMFDQEKKRASTVICSQDCVLWSLDFTIFRYAPLAPNVFSLQRFAKRYHAIPKELQSSMLRVYQTTTPCAFFARFHFLRP